MVSIDLLPFFLAIIVPAALAVLVLVTLAISGTRAPRSRTVSPLADGVTRSIPEQRRHRSTVRQ